MDFKSLCEEFDKSRKKIKFYLVKRGEKKLTVIQGLDDPKEVPITLISISKSLNFNI